MMKISKLLTLLALTSLTFASDEAECPPGQYYNAQVNRCVMKKETKREKDRFARCREDRDGEGCTFDDVANEGKSQTKSVNNSSKGDRNVSTLMTAINGVTALANFYKVGGLKGSCMSTKIMGATSLYGLYSEMTLEDDVNGKVSKLKSKYKQESEDEENFRDSQLKAFDYLREEQEVEKKYASDLASYQKTMMMGYYAAAAVATWEAFYRADGCAGESSESDTTAETETAPEPEATEATNTEPGFLDKTLGPVASTLGTPVGVAFAGVIAGTWSMQIADDAEKDVEAAKDNIKTVDKIREGFIASVSSLCPDGREDLKQPYCYCYLANGKENPNRGKSATCQALFQKQNIYVKTSDFSRLGGKAKAQGCVFVDGKFDPDCNCKKLKNSSGQNACRKLNMPQPVLTALGTNTGLEADLEKIGGGFTPQPAGTVIDASSQNSNAIGSALRDKILKMAKTGAAKKGINPKKLENSIAKTMGKVAGGNTKNFFMGGASDKLAAARPAGEAFQKAVAKAAPKLKKKKFGFKGGKGLVKKKVAPKKKKNNFFMFGEEESGETVAETDEDYMNKKYKYKNNDIVRNKGVSIFKIISNRYTQSGLRRLFEGDTKQ